MTNNRTYSGTITFDTNVLGIALLDATLAGSNFLGAPGTLYSTSGQGFELGLPDTVTLSADRRTVTILNFANTASDDLRIITAVTAAVPEPGTLSLMMIGVVGFVASRLRSEKSSPERTAKGHTRGL
jgi:hypothetical protein